MFSFLKKRLEPLPDVDVGETVVFYKTALGEVRGFTVRGELLYTHYSDSKMPLLSIDIAKNGLKEQLRVGFLEKDDGSLINKNLVEEIKLVTVSHYLNPNDN